MAERVDRPDDADDDDTDDDDGRGSDGPGMDGAEWLRRAGEAQVPVPTRALGSALWLAPLLAGVACAVVGGLVVGGTGVVAGLVGGLVVLAFFAGGTLPLTMSQGLGDPSGLGLLLLMTNYAFRVVAALVVVALLVRLGWVDRATVGTSVIVCALVRVNTQVLLLARRRRDAPASG